MNGDVKTGIICGTVDIKTLAHISKKDGETPASYEGVPMIPFYVIEEQLKDEYKRWGLPLPKELNNHDYIMRMVIGSEIPISSLYPKLKSPYKSFEVIVGSVLGKSGFLGRFEYLLPVNFNAPIEEFDRLFGCLKSLSDIGICGDRSFGFGECEISINSVGRNPITRGGVFKELWDDKFIKPDIHPILKTFSERVEFNIVEGRWSAKRDSRWKYFEKIYREFHKNVEVPRVECRQFIHFDVDGLEHIDMVFLYKFRKEIRDKWKALYGDDKIAKLFGGRVYKTISSYVAYESMIKFKPYKVMVEGTFEEVEAIVDDLVSLIDCHSFKPYRDKEFEGVTVYAKDVEIKTWKDYFKINHWEETLESK